MPDILTILQNFLNPSNGEPGFLDNRNPGEKMFGMPVSASMVNTDGSMDEAGATNRGRVMQDAMAPNTSVDVMGTGNTAEVVGDGWHPKKATFLGNLMDGFLMSKGKPPVFRMGRNARNINEAMSGYADDPKAAIKRLSQIRGQEENVAKLMNQLRDDERADLAAEGLRDSRSSKFYKNIGGLLRSVQRAKDPEAAYQSALPILRRLQQKAGDEEGMLGDTYDPQQVENYIGMNIDADDQIKMEALEQYRKQRLGLDERKFESQDNYRHERLEDFDNAEQGRNTRYNTPKPKTAGGQPNAAGKLIKDNNGNVVGKVGASGTTAQIVAPDGGFQYYEVLPNGRLGKRMPNQLFEKPKGK